MHRTTILLDESARSAAKVLAAHFQISPSEAMRRALIRYRDEVCGPSADHRRRMRALLDQLVAGSDESDPSEEIKQRKREDAEW
jgi:hypothetical protein